MHEFDDADVGGHGAALGARLDESFVFFCGGDQGFAFVNIVTDRLFDEAVFSGLHGPDSGQGVPMVRCGTGHNVDRLVFENFPHIGDRLGPGSLNFFDVGTTSFGQGTVRFANEADFCAFILGEKIDVVAAATACPDEHDTKAAAWSNFFFGKQRLRNGGQ